MGREHRVLSKLWRVYPRAPRSFHYCDDDSVIGAPFVALEYREGETIRDAIPASMVRHPRVTRRVCLALVDAMADLHTLDVEASGLAELGRPDGFGLRQVTGWRDRWRRAASDESDSTMDQVATDLERTVPAATRTSIVHNDLKLDNCQFHAGDPDTVTAVLDWDMATIGDPLFDVANLLVSTQSLPVWVLGRDDVADRYAAQSGVNITNLRWYEAFATFRTGVVVQQLFARYARGESTDDRLAGYGALIPQIAARARAVLDG
jgi:aminoglycoside phosphotransferase (APT) family kinase protein